MKKSEAIYEVIRKAARPITPQEIRDIIKVEYPQFYGTESDKLAVQKKQYNSLDHALLASIYSYVKISDRFLIDPSVKPYTISLPTDEEASETVDDDLPEDLLKETGCVYVLSSGVYTAQGKRIVKMDIEGILKLLATERPVFHSEADFQHALAWEIHRNDPSARVRLEVNLGISGRREAVDILVTVGDASYAIELKYKAKMLDAVHKKEEFHLQNHSARPIGRYNFIKDVRRLERFADASPNRIGYAVLLTNDDNYWKTTERLTAIDAMFRLNDNCTLQGTLRWGAATGSGTMKGRENVLDLRGAYSIRWAEYSQLNCEGPSKFRYVLLRIQRAAAVQLPQ